MSASSCVVFFGLRFEVRPEEIKALEDRSDSRIEIARKARLQYYWGNFGGLGERHLLFVGARLGILGPENSPDITFRADDLQRTILETTSKLSLAALPGEPHLYMQWLEDV